MRIAWIGAAPSSDGGVPYMATVLLRALVRRGLEVDCYTTGPDSEIPPDLQGVAGLRFVAEPASWPLRRAPSVLRFVGGQCGRLMAQRRLARRLVREHQRSPYDLIYQFSQIEMPSLRPYRSKLPPVVVHPEVHAAGELRWHRRELALSRRCEPVWRRQVARSMLRVRAASQRRELHQASAVVAPSARFADLLATDCGYPRDRIHVVPNPVDLERFSPDETHSGGGPFRVVFVSRMAVRKGVEMVVELSHRLADLEGQVWIEVVGGPSLWSDYRSLLTNLDSRIARFAGPRPHGDLCQLYASSDALLQPSHYEPFALTVAEALASGAPVIASDQVGAAEFVDRSCCRTFRAGDAGELESVLRALLPSKDSPEGRELRELARSEAVRAFSPQNVAESLVAVLAATVAVGSLRRTP